jgi:hypothetical protein
MDQKLALYVLLLSIAITAFINYFFMIEEFARQVTNFFIIALLTSLVIRLATKRNVPFQKILRYTCIIFFGLIAAYIVYISFHSINEFKLGSLHSFMILLTFLVIAIISYVIFSSINSDL